jgi:hypothetical protein
MVIFQLFSYQSVKHLFVSFSGTKSGGVLKSMLTLNEAIIDVKKVKSKALKWFSSFLEKLQLLLKPRLIRCLILQLLPSIPTVNNLPILCLQFLKAVMKLSQL